MIPNVRKLIVTALVFLSSLCYGENEPLIWPGTNDKQLTTYVDLSQFNLVAKANDLFFMKKYGQALTEYDRVLEDHPNCKIAKIGKMNTLIELDRIDQAIFNANEFIKEYPDDLDGYAVLSKVYHDKKMYEKEKDALIEIVRLFPYAYASRARIKEIENNFEMAEKILIANLNNAPTRVKAFSYMWLGKFYERQGRIEDALECYLKSKKLVDDGYLGDKQEISDGIRKIQGL